MAMLQAQVAGRGDPFCTLEDEWLLWLAELNDDVESVVIVPVDGWAAPLADDALLGALQDAQRALASAQSDWLTLVGQAARSQVTDRVENMPIESWLAAGTSHSTRAAKADVRLARQLAEQACVADALGSGALSREQAEAITQGLDRLPDELDRGQRDAVAAHLVQLAVEFGPTALRKLVNHAVEVVAPEVAEAADRTALERAEREQQRTRYVAWRTDENGSVNFHGRLPAVEGELFKQHLSALAAAECAADALMGVETGYAQALADALAATVSHHASCEGGPAKGGDHTRVVVTMTLADLAAGEGVGTLVEGDARVSAGQARRLACASGIVPLVLDGASVPLDMGRSRRFFTPAQRLALAVRDGGCVFPGCDRTPSDCQAHHAAQPWDQGGETDLDAAALLCSHHHHLVEPDPRRPVTEHWLITLDARGKPQLHSPVRRGGTRVIRQHQRFRC